MLIAVAALVAGCTSSTDTNTKGGPAAMEIPTSVDTYALSVSPKSGEFDVVEWGTLEGAQSVLKRGSFQRHSLGHGLSVLDGGQRHDRCTQYLVFADDITMSFFTDSLGDKSTELCDLGRTMIDTAVDSLLARQPRQRTMPAESLVHRDACEFLTPGIAATLPGASGARTDRVFPAHHLCHYVASDIDIELIFSVGPDDDPTDYKRITVAGRETFQAEDRGSCDLITMLGPFKQSSSSHLAVEALELLVFADGNPSVCADAAKLADQVWRKLPG